MNRRLPFSFASTSILVAMLAFIFGLTGAPASAQDPSDVGQWSSPVTWPEEATHMNVLPNGKVMFWGTYTASTIPYIWDPVAEPNGQCSFPFKAATCPGWIAAAPAAYPLFCAGHVVMANGQLIVLGGLAEGAGIAGVPDSRVYDYTTNQWTADGVVPDMNAGRYYPTATALPSGDVLIISGDSNPTVNATPQVWKASLPACSTSPIPTSPLQGCWVNLSTAQMVLPLYPKMFVAPNGEVFYAGATPATRYLNTSGTGSWGTPKTNPVIPTADSPIVRDYGPAVMYDGVAGKILLVGGGRPPLPTAETINLTATPIPPATTPAWTKTGSMSYPRRQNNATILADGTVLVTGGSSNCAIAGSSCTTTPPEAIEFDDYNKAVYPAELWNPTTGSWTVMASMTRYRGYHSTAALLPDGRVVTAGGDYSCVTSSTPLPVKGPCSAITPQTAEIFSPPYLFQGVRPTITSAPTNVTYGQQYFVETPNAASITQVTFIRLSTVTHTFNENQRIDYLSFSQASGGINITTPANSNFAPPGHYMLFILQNGVPSVAQIVQIQ